MCCCSKFHWLPFPSKNLHFWETTETGLVFWAENLKLSLSQRYKIWIWSSFGLLMSNFHHKQSRWQNPWTAQCVWDHCVQYIVVATEHHGHHGTVLKQLKKRHYQTHFKVKIVHMYSFVSRKKHKQKKRSLLYSVIFKEWGLHGGQGVMHACTVYVKWVDYSTDWLSGSRICPKSPTRQ